MNTDFGAGIAVMGLIWDEEYTKVEEQLHKLTYIQSVLQPAGGGGWGEVVKGIPMIRYSLPTAGQRPLKAP